MRLLETAGWCCHLPRPQQNSKDELFDAPGRSGVCSYYPGFNASPESFLNIHDAKKLGQGSLSTY